jgi:hypothetical protein
MRRREFMTLAARRQTRAGSTWPAPGTACERRRYAGSYASPWPGAPRGPSTPEAHLSVGIKPMTRLTIEIKAR